MWNINNLITTKIIISTFILKNPNEMLFFFCHTGNNNESLAVKCQVSYKETLWWECTLCGHDLCEGQFGNIYQE